MANHLTLSKWLESSGVSRAEFARRCEYDPSNLTKLLAGKIRPSLDVAVRVERETGGQVAAAGWSA
jgi:transcriptional regulator with XRE-family HTH domain